MAVPDTNTFDLLDVKSSIYDSWEFEPDTIDLATCFVDSIANQFDGRYGSKIMNPKSLYGFRNYGYIPPEPPAPEPDPVYGQLYNWWAAQDANIAPTGWHVPTWDEWTTLYNYISNGGSLKDDGTDYWSSPNTGATNVYGFRALPTGFFDTPSETFGDFGYFANFWSIGTGNEDFAWYIGLHYNDTLVTRNAMSLKEYGFSIRCVRNTGNEATTATDWDGNVYTSVTIGTQRWLVENLKSNHFRNGWLISDLMKDWGTLHQAPARTGAIEAIRR